MPKPSDYPIHGIDVSKFQGDIDWNAVANSGVKFAWIKATEGGDHADERFQANWEGAKAAGVPRGAYHFVYWCRPPMEEMAFFEQNAPVEDDALPPVLDVEATPTSKTCHRHLTQEDAIADMKVMLEEMERHYGKRPIIYTTVDFYQAILSGRRLHGLPDLGPLDEVSSRRSNTGRGPGGSGNTSPTPRSPASRAMSTATPSSAPRSSGKPSCATRNRACEEATREARALPSRPLRTRRRASPRRPKRSRPSPPTSNPAAAACLSAAGAQQADDQQQ